jgi:hypothetical protein
VLSVAALVVETKNSGKSHLQITLREDECRTFQETFVIR